MMPEAKVLREEFLSRLEQVMPGIAPRGIADQSSCFVFRNGDVFTFNEQIACRGRAILPKEFIGAVQSKPLIDLLRKLPDKSLTLSNGGGKLVLSGNKKKRCARITLQSEIVLPIDQVQRPDKDQWKPLPEDFGDAVKIVAGCASSDETKLELTCVHLNPKFIEACDEYQSGRYRLKLPIKKDMLVKAKSLKAVADLPIVKFAESESWIHFKSSDGVIISCRLSRDEWKEDLSPIFVGRGTPIELPKKLGDVAARAKIFSVESEDQMLHISLKNKLMEIAGIGINGDFVEQRGINYRGDPMAFRLTPDLLMEIDNRHSQVEITPNRIRIDGGKWVYVASLEDPDNSIRGD